VVDFALPACHAGILVPVRIESARRCPKIVLELLAVLPEVMEQTE